MIKYKIALVNVFWSENENNTRYFINKNEQNSYFDSLASGKTSPLVNYNMGNNIVTTVVYKDTTTRRVDEVVKSNYAIVYTIDYNEETKEETILNRRYFFAYPRQDSGRQMIVDLVLDDVQTNYISQQNSFNREVKIFRANLNRYVYDDETGKFKFNLGIPDSPFYQMEDFEECPKRLVSRTPLYIHPDYYSPTTELNTFFDRNIIGWEYVYLTPDIASGSQYKSLSMDGSTYKNIKLQPIRTFSYSSDTGSGYSDTGRFTNGNTISGALICLCAPVYAKNSEYGDKNVLKVSANINGTTVDIALTNYGLEEFLKENGQYSRVYARKFSIKSPFDWGSYDNVSYDSTNNVLTLSNFDLNDPTNIIGGEYLRRNNINVMFTGTLGIPSNVRRHGCIFLNVDNTTPAYTQTLTIDKQIEFTPAEIVTGSKDDIKFNPKLLSNQFYEINITNFSQSYTYDFQKINKEQIRFIYTEALTPDITKGYARLIGENGLYVEECSQNLTGLVISNDQSLMFANDKLSEMLANNKNFYLQQAINIGQKTILGGLGGSMSGGALGGGIGVAGGLLDIPKMMMNIDNMRSAPNQVSNANGNVYFATKIQPFKLAVEEYESLDFDKKAFNDYCYMFGYKYNRMGYLRDFVNIRHNFNYIEADLINVPMNMQNEEKRRLIEKFKSGIRFWNTDLMSYTGQNYENNVYEQYQEEIANE